MSSRPAKKARTANDSSDSSTAPAMVEQGTQTPRICVNCSELFDPAMNPRGSCVRHPGEAEPDFEDEAWADMYEGDGEITAERFFDDVPEAFIWDCCDKRGDEPGCEKDSHRAKVEKIM